MTQSVKQYIKLTPKIFVFLGVGLTLFHFVMGGVKPQYFFKQSILNGFASVILWVGNGIIGDYLNEKIPWTRNTTLRVVVSFFATVVYTFLAYIAISYVWILLFNPQVQLIKMLNFGDFMGSLLITIFISAIVHGKSFLKEWKLSIIEAEKLKKDHIAAQYETLKNQVNPHFLFNSFNVLTTLVHKDADLAEQFVRQLSNVYRYVLDSRDKEIVPLDLELKELEAYIFLMKIRFGESLKATLKPINTEGVSVAPLTLQMLVENALKHNEVSKAHPLSIDVFQEGDYIIVKNNIQIKNSVGESTGVGLENIKSRYTFLTDKKVEISENNDYFIVKIPLI